jgi:dihydroorotate dehydrogenase electron transfer subunit
MKIVQTKVPITSALEVMPETYYFRLQAPSIARTARPGQFIMVRCGEETILPRPISIHSVDENQKEIALLFSVAGKGTAWLSLKKKGDTLDIFGPLGNGFSLKPDVKNILLVAGGIGIAPLRFLADTAAGEGKKVTVILGARTCNFLLPVKSPRNLYDRGMLAASFYCVNATEDGSEGFKGLATDLIPAYLEGVDQVFACGPVPMYRTMAQMPELKDLPVQVSLEIMMGCGVGVCYGCTIKTKNGLKQACKDGPVFEIGELEGLNWDDLCRG